MPFARTQKFGILEYDAQAEIEFPLGLPGFEHLSRFVLVEQSALHPIAFLQSLQVPDLCFLTVPVALLEATYQLTVAPEELRLLDLDPGRQPEIGGEVLCLAILAAAENCPATATLLAPIVVSLSNRRAVQSVRYDQRYSHQHVLGETHPDTERLDTPRDVRQGDVPLTATLADAAPEKPAEPALEKESPCS